MTVVTVAFDGKWLKGLKNDEKNPVKLISDFVSEHTRAECIEQSDYSCKILVENDVAEELARYIREMLEKEYDIPGDALSITFSRRDANGGDEKNNRSKVTPGSIMSGILRSKTEKGDFTGGSGRFASEKENETEADPEFLSGASKKETDRADSLDDLIGADEFKALIREIRAVAPVLKDNNAVDALLGRSYLFSVNSGYGMNTYARILASTLADCGLMKLSEKLPVVTAKVRDSYTQGGRLLAFASDIIGKVSDCVLVLDISEIMSKIANPEIREALGIIRKNTENVVIVFTVPFLESNVLLRLSAALNDIMTVKAVTIAPFSDTQLLSYAEGRLAKKGFSVEPGAMDAFALRINEEKNDGRFYGTDTVNKIIGEVIYSALCDGGKPVISAASIKKTMLNLDAIEEYGYDTLDKMIGMEKIKDQITEIVAQIKAALNSESIESPCIHMSFVGNPGTGKTTVARVLGTILREENVLRNGSFFEVTGRDLCGRYVGETAPKTSAICRDAYGSVLFIDEAYSLYRGDSFSDSDYGREALDTLVAEMENHRSDFVVIMAGYTDDMNTMIKGNAGLRSRMPYQIVFPNYTKEQLAQIFFMMAEKSFELDESVKAAVKDYFNKLPDEVVESKSFSNARYVRNLFERTWGKAMLRSQLGGEQKIIAEDFITASGDGDFGFSEEKKPRIGF